MSIKNVEYSPKYPYKIVKKLLKATQKHNIFVEKQVKMTKKGSKKQSIIGAVEMAYMPFQILILRRWLIIGRDIYCTVVRTQNISVRISLHHPSYKPKIEN